MKAITLAAVVAALLCATAGAARTPVTVPAFDSIGLEGGGRVTVRHGTTQSVTLVRGSLDMTRFTVARDGKLEIRACERSCSNYDLEVEIVSPVLEGIGIEGGGEIRAAGAFPERDALAIGIRGGGEIDVRAIPAATIAAGISGGGSILVHARDRLAAGIDGGGEIRYLGNPTVTSGINGGGSVSPLRTR
jgi:hypothetical protein